MRRFLVTLAVLAILVGVSTPATAQDIAAMSFEQLTIANASKTLAEATVNLGGKTATRCVGVLETASVRIRVDGTAASATVGTLVSVGAFVDIRGIDNVRRFSAFRTGGTSGVLPLTCFPSPAETTATAYLNLTATPAVNAAGLSTDGTSSLPGMAFASDPDSGVYRIGANNLGLVVGATKVIDLATTVVTFPVGVAVTGNVPVTGEVLVREAFLGPLAVFEQDFTAKVLTDGGTNYVLGSASGLITYREEQNKTASSWVVAANKLDITADNTIDNEGVEIYLGDGLLTDASSWILTGTTGGCFEVNFTINLIAGTDQFVAGWRKHEAFRDDNVYAGYNEWAVVGINNVDGSVFALGEVNAGGTLSDDSGTNAANGETHTLKSCLAASSKLFTGFLDGTAITMTNNAGAHTAAVSMSPFISYLQAGGAVDAGITINWWQITR